jgi:hypothetical protein
MPNPSGVNQLGESHVPYGEAKRMKTLAGEAPMSGAPLATSALQAPRRARRNPQPQAQPVEAPVPVHPDYQQMPSIPTAQVYAGIASIPGASPLVQEIFGGSQLPPR